MLCSLKIQKGKLKVTLVQALGLCTGRTAHRGSRGIALPFHDHGTRRGEGSASRHGRSLPPGNTRYPLYRRLCGPAWIGAENLTSTELRCPDRPARSQSLYRLSYPAHKHTYVMPKARHSFRQFPSSSDWAFCTTWGGTYRAHRFRVVIIRHRLWP